MEHRMREWLRLYRELGVAERALASDERNREKQLEVRQLRQRCNRAFDAMQSAALARGGQWQMLR